MAEERVLCQRVIQRLKSRFLGRLEVEPVIWEHEPLLATATFQDQIVLPSETEIVVCILWSRLGTRLPAHITRADGSRYASGTEFEFEDAVRAFEASGSPELLVYRKTAEPRMGLGDEAALLDRLEQKKALDAFFARWFETGDGSLSAAFSPYRDLAEFEGHLERHLEKLLVRKLVAAGDAAAAEAPPLWREGSPYRGLETFEVEHAPVFFGRTRAVHDVLDALRAQAAEGRAFVNVLGMSGGGKSSLARAGVLPLLSQAGVIEGVGLWRRAVMRPADAGGDPFAALAAALASPETLPALAEADGGAAGLARWLREAPRDGLTAALAARLESALERSAAELQAEKQLLARPVARLILLVDQLEEIFTLEHLDDGARAAFVEALDALARGDRAWVLATLRSDFFPRCAELPVLVALQERAGQVHLLRPAPAEIGEMIRKPAAAAGLGFDHDPEADMGLDDVLRDAAAASPEALPLLEFTLEQLYQGRDGRGVLTFDAYRRLGGVEGALARRAEEVFEGLAPEVRAALPRVLGALVQVSQAEDGAVSRRRADYATLCAEGRARALVDALVGARLLVTELGAGDRRTVAVSHEALLRHWPRVTAWVEENRQDLRVLGRLGAAALRWQEEGRSADFLLAPGKPLVEAEELAARWGDELEPAHRELIGASAARARRRVRIRRLAVAALAVLAAVAGVSAFLADVARGKEQLRRGQAEDLITFMLGDLRAKLEPVGRLEVLADVGNAAEKYFESLAGEDLTPADVARQGLAIRQIGEVRMAEGDLGAAFESFQTSMGLARTLAAAAPEDEDRRYDLAQAHFWIGYVHYARGDLDAAVAEFEAYREIAGRELARRPESPRWLLEVSYALGNLGTVLLDRFETGAALAAIRRSIELRERLVALDPARREWRRDLAEGHAWLGTTLLETGEATADPFHRALALLENLVEEDPKDTGAREAFARVHNSLGLALEELGDAAGALERYRAAGRTLRGLTVHDPTNGEWQGLLAESHGGMSEALFRLGRLDEAAAERRSAHGLVIALVEQDPRQLGWRLAEARHLVGLGRILLASADLAGAWSAAASGLEAAERIAADEPEDYAAAVGLMEALRVVAEVETRRGRAAAARGAWERVLEVGDLLEARGRSRSLVLEKRARAALRLDRPEEAAQYLKQLREIDDPELREFARSRGMAHVVRGHEEKPT